MRFLTISLPLPSPVTPPWIRRAYAGAALVLGLAAALAFTGCTSAEFRRGWTGATTAAEGPTPPGIEGAWEGEWRSETNGHHGKLRCVVTEAGETEAANDFVFHYWATWAGILSGDFKAIFAVTAEGRAYHIRGESDLGSFGVFKHDGRIEGTRFEARYEAAGDHGVFALERPH